MKPLAILFALLGVALAVASAFVALSAWQPFSASPPLAGILGAMAIASLVGFALASGLRSDFINLAALLAFIALGHLLLAADYSIARFLLGVAHIAGFAFFASHLRTRRSGSQMALAAAFLLLVPLIVWMTSAQMLLVLYAATVGLLAASAWLSRFSRLTTGLGIVLYAASDLAQFTRWTADFMTLQLREGLGVAAFMGLLLASVGIVRAFARPDPGLR